ncbi:hypothetical protein EGH82_15135 [Vibrio ponticus]|uniref:Uncharacterized protein n=1 Tax=Vibrio ponticus TaxID=265668 RepID=A0A3N3DXM3_9VIBR|nr:hypothetical protein EGH82_15135 [Vibrio ponticus]
MTTVFNRHSSTYSSDNPLVCRIKAVSKKKRLQKQCFSRLENALREQGQSQQLLTARNEKDTAPPVDLYGLALTLNTQPPRIKLNDPDQLRNTK